jgi:hypothetical protein
MHVLRISTLAATGGRAPSGPIATVGEVCRGDTAVVGRRVSSGCPGLGDLVATFTVRTGCRCRCSAFRANGVEAPARERDEGTAGRTVVSGENRLGIAPEKRSGRMPVRACQYSHGTTVSGIAVTVIIGAHACGHYRTAAV